MCVNALVRVACVKVVLTVTHAALWETFLAVVGFLGRIGGADLRLSLAGHCFDGFPGEVLDIPARACVSSVHVRSIVDDIDLVAHDYRS